MTRRNPNLLTDQELILGAQARLTKVLDSLESREKEIEGLRDRIYSLAQELSKSDNLLIEIMMTTSNPILEARIGKHFEQQPD